MISFILFILWITFSLLSCFSGIDFLFPDSSIFFWGIITYAHPVLPRIPEIFLWLLLVWIAVTILILTIREEKKLFLEEIKFGYLRFIARIVIQCVSFVIMYSLLRNQIWSQSVQYTDLLVIVLVTIFILYRHIELKEYDKRQTSYTLDENN